MKTHPSSLGDQIARMHDAVHAQERCVFIPAAIHALIIACLDRIFGRLEQLVLLWQTGQLPVPAPRQQTLPAIRQHSLPRARAARNLRRRTRARPRPICAIRTPGRTPGRSPGRAPAPSPAITNTPHPAPATRPRRRLARAPPSWHRACRQKSPLTGLQTCA